MNTSRTNAHQNDEIKSLMDKISNTASHKEFYNVLKNYVDSNPTTKQLDVNFIKNGEYYIQAGTTSDIDYLYKVLLLFKREGCTICPDEVMKASNNHGFSILITRFESAEDNNLEIYNKKDPFTPATSKEKAYKDLTKMADVGFVNADLLHNGKELKVIKPTRRIICDDWTDVTQINDYLLDYDDDGSRQSVLKDIRRIIY